MPFSKNVEACFSPQHTTSSCLPVGAETNLQLDTVWSKLSRHSGLAVGKQWRGARICDKRGKHAWLCQVFFFVSTRTHSNPTSTVVL